jgi:hypothetical protein
MVFLAQCHLAGVVGGDEASAIRACAPSRLPSLAPLWGAGPVRYGVSLCTVRFGTVRYGGQAISRFMVLISSHHVLAVAPVALGLVPGRPTGHG